MAEPQLNAFLVVVAAGAMIFVSGRELDTSGARTYHQCANRFLI
jgi:hypothetical protein